MALLALLVLFGLFLFLLALLQRRLSDKLFKYEVVTLFFR